MNSPRATVLMPVFNAAPFLKDSIDSILNQTFTDFDFLIINDGSTDDSTQIIESYRDSRIRHIKIANNRGIIKALNMGLVLANTEYIVRMDADDIALPDRVKRQVSFMDSNPEVGVSGTWVEYFGYRAGIMKAPVTHKEIVWTMLFGSPFFHSTVIMRAAFLKDQNLTYPSNYVHAEDYAFWIQMTGHTKFANIPEILLKYRFIGTSISSSNKEYQQEMGIRLKREIHAKLLGRELDDLEWEMISEFGERPIDIRRVIKIYNEISESNNLLSDNNYKKWLTIRLKQLIAKKGFNFRSYSWIINRSIRDLSLLKYIFNSGRLNQ